MTSVRLPDLDHASAAALERLRAGRAFLLCGHARPDGDCLGSEVALARVLSRLGKRVTILNPDAAEARYAYLTREVPALVYAGAALPDHDVAVFLDFNELSRTGAMAGPLARAPSAKVVVDHHVPPAEAWWDAAFVDEGAAATGVLVWRLARHLSVDLDPVAATAIFTALVTDTGWFRYSNAGAEALAIAADAVRAGADPAGVHGALFQQRSAEHARVVGRLLSEAEMLAGGRLALATQTLEHATVPEGVDTDEVLDVLRSIGAVEVVLFLREISPGICKLSARSKGDFDVNALCRRFGGGGHRKASGATLAARLSEAREAVVAAALAGFGVGGAPAAALSGAARRGAAGDAAR